MHPSSSDSKMSRASCRSMPLDMPRTYQVAVVKAGRDPADMATHPRYQAHVSAAAGQAKLATALPSWRCHQLSVSSPGVDGSVGGPSRDDPARSPTPTGPPTLTEGNSADYWCGPASSSVSIDSRPRRSSPMSEARVQGHHPQQQQQRQQQQHLLLHMGGWSDGNEPALRLLPRSISPVAGLGGSPGPERASTPGPAPLGTVDWAFCPCGCHGGDDSAGCRHADEALWRGGRHERVNESFCIVRRDRSAVPDKMDQQITAARAYIESVRASLMPSPAPRQ